MTADALNNLDQKTQYIIELFLADGVMYNVISETSAEGLWTKVESLYMAKTLSNKLYLKKQLYSIHMKGP